MNRTTPNRPSVSRLAIAGLAACCLSFTTLGRAALVSGGVLDGTTGQPLSGVQVYVDGVSTGASTDAAGKFQVDIAAGEKVLSLKKDGFIEQSLGKVEIAADGEKSLPNAKLYTKPADDVVMLDALSVEGSVVKNSVVTARQNADVSVDLLTSADFAKFTGTDIADIAVRVPGISTTSQGSFAVVRGLAERYNPVMLDGIVLPSSDPERQSPELDIFPARLVDAIVISKSFEPRLPGTSSGAAIDLRTKPLPEGKFAQLQIGIRADDDYISNEAFLGSNTGGNWDQLGFGSKDRQSIAPGTYAKRLAYVGTAANGNRFENFPIGSRISLTYEDLLVLNDESGRAFGFGISAGQDRTASTEEGKRLTVNNIFSNPSAITGRVEDAVGFSTKEYIESELETRIGVLASAGYAFNKQHQIGVSYFGSQIGSDTHTREFNGLDMSNGTFANLTAARTQLAIDANPTLLDYNALAIDNILGFKGKDEIYYRERSLTDGKVKGEHTFDGTVPTEITWTIAQVDALQKEPDFFSSPYDYIPGGTYYADYGSGGSRYTRSWRETEESTLAGRADGKFDLSPDSFPDTQLRTGYYFDRTERNYTEGGFILSSEEIFGATYSDFLNDFQNFTGGILVPGGVNSTFATGERTLDSVYGSALITLLKDQPKVHKLDMLLGVRLESYKLESTGRGALGNLGSADFYQQLDLNEGGNGAGFFSGMTFSGLIDENKALPAFGLNYSPVKPFTVRLSYSQTTARPSFREMGSYFTIDQVSDENVHGNKALTTSAVDNYDLRFEYFSPDSTDLVAFSLFYKQVTSPIERVSFNMSPAGDVSTWRNNANDAEVLGAEFEAAKNLGMLGDFGKNFTVGSNYTYINASVDRDPLFEADQITATGIDDSRPLYDQPRYIANAYLSFDHKPWGFSSTLSYFSIGDVLQKVNRSTWDSYVASHDRFDLTLVKRIGKSLSIRASARNLLDPERKFIADPEATKSEVVLRSYKDGRSYTFTAVYDF